MTNVSSTATAVGATNDIRSAKPPVEIPVAWAWVWWVLLALLLLSAVLYGWRRWRRKRQELPPVIVVPPHVRARERLEQALRYLSEPNRFCTQVADTIRVYLEERFHLRAPERTTEEFLVELQTSQHLTRDQKQTLGEFLQSCDLVKFARFEPTEEVLRQLHEAALRLVHETQFDPLSNPAPPVSPANPNPPPVLVNQ